MTTPTTFAAGSKVTAAALNGGEPFTLSAKDATNGTTASTTYTRGLAGPSAVSIDFVAPPSGKILATVGCTMAGRVGGANVFLSVELSGASAYAANDTDSMHAFSDNSFVGGSRVVAISGLTPGGAYTAWLNHRTDVGTAQWQERSLVIEYTN
jgi:hypothetical protein